MHFIQVGQTFLPAIAPHFYFEESFPYVHQPPRAPRTGQLPNLKCQTRMSAPRDADPLRPGATTVQHRAILYCYPGCLTTVNPKKSASWLAFSRERTINHRDAETPRSERNDQGLFLSSASVPSVVNSSRFIPLFTFLCASASMVPSSAYVITSKSLECSPAI